MAGPSILFPEIYHLAPVPALSFANLPPLETQSITGWMISPQHRKKVILQWPGLSHMPTPGIKGEVNSITMTMA